MSYSVIFRNETDLLWYRIGPLNKYAEAIETFEKLAAKRDINKVELCNDTFRQEAPMRSYEKKK